MELKARLLCSIEAHGKSSIHGILSLFSHERKFSVLRALTELHDEGWVKLRKYWVVSGVTQNILNVKRTSKQMYSQISIKSFTADDSSK